MKITQQEPTPPPFKPVVITLETQEEVDKFAAIVGILNYDFFSLTAFCEISKLTSFQVSEIRESLKDYFKRQFPTKG